MIFQTYGHMILHIASSSPLTRNYAKWSVSSLGLSQWDKYIHIHIYIFNYSSCKWKNRRLRNSIPLFIEAKNACSCCCVYPYQWPHPSEHYWQATIMQKWLMHYCLINVFTDILNTSVPLMKKFITKSHYKSQYHKCAPKWR